jgi:hypothetical protein
VSSINYDKTSIQKIVMRTTILYPPLYRQTRLSEDFNARLTSESSTINSSALTLEGGGPPEPPLQIKVLQSLSESAIQSNVIPNLSTVTVLREYRVPSEMKGKTGFLTGYFYLKNQIPWPSNLTMNYGFAIDNTLVGTLSGNLPFYRQGVSSNPIALINTDSLSDTVGGFTTRVKIPVTVPGNASNFNAVVSNSSLTLVNTQVGGITTFTYTGLLQTYTVPLGISNINVYLWGAGGRGPGGNNNAAIGGSGAFVTGVLSVSAGQTLFIVVGDNANSGSTDIIRGNGGSSLSAAGGGGFSAIFTSNITGLSTGAAVQSLRCLAGGGGGGGFTSTNYGGAAGVTAGGAGLGTSPGGGGTQSAGGTPNGALLRGGNAVQSGGGGGGGGYYGGGGGTGTTAGSSGGGGSSFLGTLTSVSSAGGARSTGAVVAPGGLATMQSFFGGSALIGYSGQTGGVAISAQVIFPTFIGSEINCVY